MDFSELTIKELHSGLKKKYFSSVELTKAYLSEIKKNDKKAARASHHQRSD